MAVFLLALVGVLVSQPTPEPHLGLRDSECGAEDILTGDFQGILIYAKCGSRDGERIMHVAVQHLGSAERAVRAFSIGFCGRPIVSARSPAGWEAHIGQSNQSIEWSVPNDSTANLVARGQRLDGFSVALKTGWRRSWYMSVQWDGAAGGWSGGGATSTTHDCLE